MGITLANNAHTTLSADASSTDTVIYVEDIDSFPTLDVDDYFYLTLERTSGALEIVKVTQINASSFNVVRGQENTIPISFSIGSHAKLNMTVQNITDLILTGSNIDDGAYDPSWDGDTDDAPSRNAVYDKFVSVDAAHAATAALVADGDKGDISISGSGANWLIDNNAVTYAKIQQVASSRILGRITAGAGTAEELTSANVKTILALAQADISGLTTADSPTFTDVSVTGLGVSGTATISGGNLVVGSAKYNGPAYLQMKYDNAVGASGTIYWTRDGTPRWRLFSGSAGTWTLINEVLATNALSFASASNNATFTGTVTVGGQLDIVGGSLSSTNGLHAYFLSNTGYLRSLENGVAWRALAIDGATTTLNASSAGPVVANGSYFLTDYGSNGASTLYVGGANDQFASINLRANSGKSRYLGFFTGTSSARWLIECESTAESGANAGSNFAISNWSDAGAYLNTPFYIARASGAVSLLGVAMGGPINLKSYTVAGLPAGSAGDTVYASNGRKNGEGAGAGTGVMVFKDGTAWRACDTGATVAA